MADESITDLFNFQTMLGVIQRIKAGLPTEGLPAGLLTPSRTVPGYQGTYLRVDGNRQTATAVAYGDPSVAVDQAGIAEIGVTLLHYYENQLHKPAVLAQLKDFNSPERQKLGQMEIARQTGRFKTRYDNTRIATVMSAITQGAIYLDGDGHLLPTATGAVTTVDFGIPAGQKNQLDIMGNGNIIDASWASAGTDVLGHMARIKVEMAHKGGWVPTLAIYGENIPGYLAANTAIKNMIHGNPTMAMAFAQGGVGPGLGGFEWMPGFAWHYLDHNNAMQVWLDADAITFLPPVDPTWYDLLEGTFAIPTTAGVVGEVPADILMSLSEQAGYFSYCTLTTDPPAVKHLAGDTFLPVIKSPYSVCFADIAP